MVPKKSADNIYIDTTTDHITPCCACVRGVKIEQYVVNKKINYENANSFTQKFSELYHDCLSGPIRLILLTYVSGYYSPISRAIIHLRFLHSNNSNWGHSTSMLHTSGWLAQCVTYTYSCSPLTSNIGPTCSTHKTQLPAHCVC